VASLIAPAETVGTNNTGLRQHVGLDGGNPLEVPALMHQPAPDGPGVCPAADEPSSTATLAVRE
jgi:hypothetical protein